MFVKYFNLAEQRLLHAPEVVFDMFISVEGDLAKRTSNPMIRERLRNQTGRYRVADRYGVWLCKDYIPVMRINDWLPRIGTGSTSYIDLHGFVNCQNLKLTANRGAIANTDPKIITELKQKVAEEVSRIDDQLKNMELYTARSLADEETTMEKEKKEFTRRIRNLSKRNQAKLGEQTIFEPSNESELFGLFMIVYTIHPELFDFEPLDYNTNSGVDIIARNKNENVITEKENWYIELKHTLQQRHFNHIFHHLRYIVCWDFDRNVGKGDEFEGIQPADIRYLDVTVEDSFTIYHLDNPKRGTRKIEVIRLKEFLKERLKIEFQSPK